MKCMFIYAGNCVGVLTWLILCMQNGTTEQVDKIVKTLNDGQIPSTDVVGTEPNLSLLDASSQLFFYMLVIPEKFSKACCVVCLSLWNCCIAEVVVSPPYVFIPVVKSQLRPEIQVAAQNCWVKKGGAYTGEVRLVLHSAPHAVVAMKS